MLSLSIFEFHILEFSNFIIFNFKSSRIGNLTNVDCEITNAVTLVGLCQLARLDVLISHD